MIKYHQESITLSVTNNAVEYLYNFGLINMNGRLYDPLVGRMLSPDFEKRAYDEMYKNHGIFFNLYNDYIIGHVVNATTATQFILNDKTLAHEIRIWDSGLDNNGQVEGYKSLLFYDLNKLYGKFGVFHIKER